MILMSHFHAMIPNRVIPLICTSERHHLFTSYHSRHILATISTPDAYLHYTLVTSPDHGPPVHLFLQILALHSQFEFRKVLLPFALQRIAVGDIGFEQ